MDVTLPEAKQDCKPKEGDDESIHFLVLQLLRNWDLENRIRVHNMARIRISIISLFKSEIILIKK